MQILLPFEKKTNYSFENYYPFANINLINTLKNEFNNPKSTFIYILGQNASGKTHILKSCINLAQINNIPSKYLDCKTSLLDNTIDNNLKWLCIDNIEALSKDSQLVLFDIYNKSIANNLKIILSSRIQPNNLQGIIKDLTTRLNLANIINLNPLSDEQILSVLKEKYLAKNIAINDKIFYYLLNNYQRNIGFLFSLLDYIVQIAIQNKTKISIRLIKNILQDEKNNQTT